MNRQYLVTVFRCSACGEPMTISYEGKRGASVSDGHTGAAKVEQTVHVDPCQGCLKPMRDLKDAMSKIAPFLTGA